MLLYKGLKGAASILIDDLIHLLDAVEVITYHDFSDPHCKNWHLQNVQGIILSSNRYLL